MTFITKREEFGLDQFDLLWKDFFNTSSPFSDLLQKVSHPTNIYETETSIIFEIAAVGLDKEDISITTDGNTLRIKHNKATKQDKNLVYSGIKKGSFDLGWKIASKFDLSKLEASLDKGLLTIEIPLSEKSKPRQVEIK